MNKKKSKGTQLLCTSRMLTVMIVLSVFIAGIGIVPVSAQVASVTRDLPVFVETDEEFEVTLTQTGFDSGMGTVVETLPVDFEYVYGSYTGGGANKEETVTYNETTRKLRAALAFVDEEYGVLFSVTYRVTASLTEQNAVFVGEYAAWTGAEVTEPDDVGGDPEVGVDGFPPYTEWHDPEKNGINVPVDTNITVRVKDNFSVDPNSIGMTVNFVDVTSQLTITPAGFWYDWLVTYDPEDDFEYGEIVTVAIDASDPLGHAMTTDMYSFTTEVGIILGDITGNGVINIGDVVRLANYVGTGFDPAYEPIGGHLAGDMNDNGVVNIGDVVRLANYVGTGFDPAYEPY